MHYKYLLTTLAGLLVASGCARVRVASYAVSPGGRDDERGYHAKTLRLEDGVTSRAVVERILGRPELIEEDGRLAAYRWQRVRYPV